MNETPSSPQVVRPGPAAGSVRGRILRLMREANREMNQWEIAEALNHPRWKTSITLSQMRRRGDLTRVASGHAGKPSRWVLPSPRNSD